MAPADRMKVFGQDDRTHREEHRAVQQLTTGSAEPQNRSTASRVFRDLVDITTPEAKAESKPFALNEFAMK